MSDRVNTAVWFEKYGRWQIKVQKDGVRRTFTSAKPGRTGQREANAKADAWLSGGVGSKGRRLTVSDVYPDYLASLKLRTSQSNWIPKESRWRNRILPYIGAVRLSALNDQLLQNVVDANFADGLSKKTLRNIAGDIREFLKFCRKSGYTDYRAEELDVPAGARYKGKKVLQPDDLAKLFSCTFTRFRRKVVFDEWVYAYRFQVVTGLRPGELIGMEWSDIAGDFLNLKRSINQYGELTKGKNENAVRSIRLFPLAKEILRQQYEMAGGVGSVFEIDKEARYYKALQRFCKFNGFTACSAYELRHTFVSAVKTLPDGEVRDWVGHSEDMDTFGTYSHTLVGDDLQSSAAINAVFLRLLALSKSAQK